MYLYLQCYLSLLWKLMNTLVLRFVAMNASLKYSVIINFHENYYEYANYSVHRCKVDWCIGKHGWKSEIWRIPFLLAFVFYFLSCKCLERFTNVSYIFFLLNMTLWSYIVFFIIPIVLQSIIIVLLSAVFPIKLLANNMWFHSLFQ